jgi:hypothetical protein
MISDPFTILKQDPTEQGVFVADPWPAVRSSFVSFARGFEQGSPHTPGVPTGVLLQPVAVEHASCVQTLLSLQKLVVPLQMPPAAHASFVVQGLLSSHVVPTVLFVAVGQLPVEGMQAPWILHVLVVVQTLSGPGVQTPPIHESFTNVLFTDPVHILPSASHNVPLATAGCWQTPP